jgi:Lon protease-like protein
VTEATPGGRVWKGAGVVVTPMFPLGTVLVPGMILPLHVFEPRYRQMLDDCMAGERSFGVVLIERGSEVGGGDVRTGVGTLAGIAQAEQLPDGRWGLVAIGLRRIRIDRWLPDDPYPRAEVSDWPDERDGDGPGGAGTGASAVPETLVPLLRRAAALARELGMPAAPLDLELDDDPTTAGYQAIAAAPLGPADRQSLLAAPTLADRWTLLDTLLADQIELLEAELAHGGG